jgi:ABC-type transport system substrate-binding protein
MAGVDFQELQNDLVVPQQISTGALDYSAVKDSQVPSLKSLSNLKYVVSPSNQYAELFINYGMAPWNDLKVRQALEYALNRPLLAQSLTSGADQPATQPISPTSWAHNPTIDNLYPYDVNKAKQLVADAGYPTGLHVKVAEIDFDYYRPMAEAVQAMLKQANIFIDLAPVAGSAINQVLYVTKQYSAAVTAYAGNNDPGQTLSLKFGVNGVNNPSHMATAGLDDLLAKGAASASQSVRQQAYRDAAKIIMDNALSVPFFFNSGVTVYQPKVQGVTFGQTTCHQSDFSGDPPVYVAS